MAASSSCFVASGDKLESSACYQGGLMMKRYLVILLLISGLSGCGEQGDKVSSVKNSKSNGWSIDWNQCGEASNDVGEIIRPLRTLELRTAEAEGAPKFVNEKATRIMGKTHYHKIDPSERVFHHCEKGAASYVTMIEPEWLKGVSGWVNTAGLRVMSDPSNPYEGKISNWVLEDYPDISLIEGSDPSDPTYKRFSAKVREINQLKVAAAKRAIDTGKCEHVSSVLFLRNESTLSNLRFMVDCEDNKRIELTSSDIASSSMLRTNEEKALTKSEAMTKCKILIVERLVNKSSVNFSELLGSSYYRAPITGNVRLTLDFEAANKLGQSISHRAECIFDPGGDGEVTIAEK
ncbi:hypothetical protein EQ836_07670 [Ectopseudomonas mendocina]|uniref:Lipoprotein n=1 Tax=Ectopseudomonas mendocina TaxID=300 RepID=A0ABD7RZK6_ECTME|nr:hypothetical protein [Pseudomonas mendocina]TRO14344.1 hypothetical protein EQ829_10065 [Pseudomonas mendocina]TRO19395.1 hypothetical protein EQ836_07670 [Pseudomonas mendocina]